MCQYTQSLEGLGNGDVAVFSVGFNVSEVKDLRRKGVPIAFESGENPVHMPHLSRDQLEQGRSTFFHFGFHGSSPLAAKNSRLGEACMKGVHYTCVRVAFTLSAMLFALFLKISNLYSITIFG